MTREKEFEKQFQLAVNDAAKDGIGILCNHQRVSSHDLQFIWAGKEFKKEVKNKAELLVHLARLEDIYKKKFSDSDPYDLELFKQDEGFFVERMIRAVEICTLKHVLNIDSGALNLSEFLTITKGRYSFLWETMKVKEAKA